MPKPMNLVGSVGRTILLVCLFAVLPAGCKLEAQRSASGFLLLLFEDDREEDSTQSEQDYQEFTFSANKKLLDGIKSNHKLDVTDNKLHLVVLPRADKGYIFGSWAKGGLYGGTTDPVVSVSTGFGVGPAWQDYFKNSQDIVTIKARYRKDPRREPASICEPRIAVFPGYETTTNSTVDSGGNQLNVTAQREYLDVRKTGDARMDLSERIAELIKDSFRELGRRKIERDMRLTVHTSNAQKATGLAIRSERIDTTFADGQRQTVLWDYSGNPLVTLPTHLDLDNNVYEQTINALGYAGDNPGPKIAQELLEEVQIKTRTEYQGWTERNVNGGPATGCLFAITRTETETDGTQTVFTSNSWVSSVDTVAGITVASENSSSRGGSEIVTAEEVEIDGKTFEVRFIF